MVSFTIGYAQADDGIREGAMAQRKYSVMSVEDYLVLNRNSKDTRYEYLDGEIRRLAGGSPDHSIIIANLTAAIKGSLKGRQCRVYNSDLQLRLSDKRYVFPDVTIRVAMSATGTRKRRYATPASSSKCYLQPQKLPTEAKKQHTIERVQQYRNT